MVQPRLVQGILTKPLVGARKVSPQSTTEEEGKETIIKDILCCVILVCLKIVLHLYILGTLYHLVGAFFSCSCRLWQHYIISFCYFMYPMRIMHKVSLKKNSFKCSLSQYHSTKLWSIQITTVHSCHKVYFDKCESSLITRYFGTCSASFYYHCTGGDP